ncbi:MAG: diadenosine tetraphosphatase [Gammaproteobacteria bacterium]|nr:MAG: diadenosine tetraphosphatase [Gammaproteobacteria bacterium]
MSIYIIGDVHGCYDELLALLQKIRFHLAHDKLVFVGDLVNRGRHSVDVLRFVKGLGDSAQVVLGNHDISLLAYAVGAYHGRKSDFPQIVQAADSEALLNWLRQQPLLIHDETLDIVVTHAGIPPRWSLAKAVVQAQKAEKKLRGKKYHKYLKAAYKKGNNAWQKDFNKYDKFRYRINGFTRLRYCDDQGEPDFADKCPVGKQADHLVPWFAARKARQDDRQTRLFFGHWAALGYYQTPQVICLDSGCVWGGELTAVKVEKDSIRAFNVAAG